VSCVERGLPAVSGAHASVLLQAEGRRGALTVAASGDGLAGPATTEATRPASAGAERRMRA
jgi:hypothetical protein